MRYYEVELNNKFIGMIEGVNLNAALHTLSAIMLKNKIKFKLNAKEVKIKEITETEANKLTKEMIEKGIL